MEELGQDRPEQHDAEESDHDRGDAGQELDDRLEDLADAPMRDVGEVGGDADPDRHGQDESAGRDHERADDHGQEAVFGLLRGGGIPACAAEEFGDLDLPEGRHGGRDEGQEDADEDEHGRDAGGEEEGLDGRFLQGAPLLAFHRRSSPLSHDALFYT